eukprot:tig00020553_g10603.t1
MPAHAGAGYEHIQHKEFALDFSQDGQLTPRERHGLHGQLQVELFSGKGFEGTKHAVVLFSVGEDLAETPVARRDPRTGLFEFSFNQEHAFEIEPFSYPKILLKVYDCDNSKRVGAIKMSYNGMAVRSPPESEVWVSVATPAARRHEVGPVSGELHVRVRFAHHPDSSGFVPYAPQFSMRTPAPAPRGPAPASLRWRRSSSGGPGAREPLLTSPTRGRDPFPASPSPGRDPFPSSSSTPTVRGLFPSSPPPGRDPFPSSPTPSREPLLASPTPSREPLLASPTPSRGRDREALSTSPPVPSPGHGHEGPPMATSPAPDPRPQGPLFAGPAPAPPFAISIPAKERGAPAPAPAAPAPEQWGPRSLPVAIAPEQGPPLAKQWGPPEAAAPGARSVAARRAAAAASRGGGGLAACFTLSCKPTPLPPSGPPTGSPTPRSDSGSLGSVPSFSSGAHLVR